MKALVVLRAVDHDQVFASVLDAALGRGHAVHVALDDARGALPGPKAQLLEDLGRRHPGFGYQQLEPRRDVWRVPANVLRRRLARLTAGGGERRSWPVRALMWLLRRLEAAIPVRRPIRSLIKQTAADVVLVSPFAEFGAAPGDVLRTANASGVPSVLLLVQPSDLANAGPVRFGPTLTVASSEDELDEAVRLHGLAREGTRAVGNERVNGFEAIAPNGAVEAIEQAARAEVTPRRDGRLLRPLLWLLTPIVAVLLVVLRPRVTARAAFRAVRRLSRRTRKRAKTVRRDMSRRRGRRAALRAQRREAKARAEKQEEKARIRAAKEEKARLRAVKEEEARARAERAARTKADAKLERARTRRASKRESASQ